MTTSNIAQQIVASAKAEELLKRLESLDVKEWVQTGDHAIHYNGVDVSLEGVRVSTEEFSEILVIGKFSSKEQQERVRTLLLTVLFYNKTTVADQWLTVNQ